MHFPALSVMRTVLAQERADYIIVKVEIPRLANDVLPRAEELDEWRHCTILHSVGSSPSFVRNMQIISVSKLIEGTLNGGRYSVIA